MIDTAAKNDETLTDYLKQMKELGEQEWSGETAEAAEAAVQSWHDQAGVVLVDKLRLAGEFMQRTADIYDASSARPRATWRVM